MNDQQMGVGRVDIPPNENAAQIAARREFHRRINAVGVPFDWDGLAERRDNYLDGELAAIRHYAKENHLPPGFIRLAFNVGVSAYLAALSDPNLQIPMPFRRADGSPNDGDVKTPHGFEQG